MRQFPAILTLAMLACGAPGGNVVQRPTTNAAARAWSFTVHVAGMKKSKSGAT